MTRADIPGYTDGTAAVGRSPVSLQELEPLEAVLLQVILWSQPYVRDGDLSPR